MYDHRIVEYPELEGIHQDHRVQLLKITESLTALCDSTVLVDFKVPPKKSL